MSDTPIIVVSGRAQIATIEAGSQSTATVQATQPATGTVALTGFPGPPGPQGPEGPAGPAGPGAETMTFVQSAPAATWMIDVSGFSYIPNVTVVDSAGSVVEGDPSYSIAGLLTISFSAAFSGRAYLS